MFPTVPRGWGDTLFYLSTLFFSCIPFGWHKKLRTHSIFFLYYLEMLLTHTKGHLSGENKSYHSPLFVFPMSAFASVFLPSVLSADPIKGFQWCSWVLVMKWRFHSVAARSLGWTAGQVKLWQGSLWYTFPHCPARIVRTFSMLIFPYGLWIFVHWSLPVQSSLDETFSFCSQKQRIFLMHFFQ